MNGTPETGAERVLAIVTGPTASGKTGLAISLARHFGTDVISADSRQMFRDIPIGTAAPGPEEQALARHHFVGTLPLDAYYSAARFETDVLALLPSLWRRSPVAVMCGGSMMYVDAVVRSIDEMPTISASTRAYVLNMLDQQGLEGVLAQLRICDPVYWQQVDRANTRRVVHALEICLEAGVPCSSLRKGSVARRDFRIVKMMIDRPREELFDRINRRVDLMMAQGLEAEARAALAQGEFNSLNTVGYKEMAAYFRGDMDRATAIARIARNTRVYAKKQLTWLARDPTVIRLDPATAFESALAAIAAAADA